MSITTVPVTPVAPKDWDVILEDTNYKMAVHKFAISQSSSTSNYVGGGGNSHTDQSTPTYTAAVDYAQDWDNPASFANFLFDRQGETIPLTFRPRSGVGVGWRINAIISTGDIGGAINTFMTSSVTLGVDGKPERLPAVVTP